MSVCRAGGSSMPWPWPPRGGDSEPPASRHGGYRRRQNHRTQSCHYLAETAGPNWQSGPLFGAGRGGQAPIGLGVASGRWHGEYPSSNDSKWRMALEYPPNNDSTQSEQIRVPAEQRPEQDRTESHGTMILEQDSKQRIVPKDNHQNRYRSEYQCIY